MFNKSPISRSRTELASKRFSKKIFVTVVILIAIVGLLLLLVYIIVCRAYFDFGLYSSGHKYGENVVLEFGTTATTIPADSKRVSFVPLPQPLPYTIEVAG